MPRLISHVRPDGSIEIIIPAPDLYKASSATRELLRKEGTDPQTEDDILEYVVGRNNLQPGSYHYVDSDDIPKDRYFRDAWKSNMKSINVDRLTAEGVHLKILRALRDAKLKELDIAFMKATERNNSDQIQAIIKKKQDLRDLPSTIDLKIPKSLEDLKAYIPEILM